MKNTGCSLLLALLLCGCTTSPAVVPFHYDNGPDYVREGLYRIVDDRGRMGYADESGRVVIAPRFAFALPFEGGKAKVTDTGQRKEVPGSGGEHWYWESDAWYFIDTTGRKTDDPQARRHPTAVKTGTSPLPPVGPFTGRPVPARITGPACARRSVGTVPLSLPADAGQIMPCPLTTAGQRPHARARQPKKDK